MKRQEPNMRKKVQILKKKLVYNGYFKIFHYQLRHTLYDGKWGNKIAREVFERGNAAAVILYDPKRDKLVLIEQFRIGAQVAKLNPWVIEIVAGKIEKGESGKEVVKRESLEESGCKPSKLIHITDYQPSGGGASEIVSLFCGKVDSKNVGGIYGVKEEGEDIKVVVKSLGDALKMVDRGIIANSASIIGIQWLTLNKKKIRKKWL